MPGNGKCVNCGKKTEDGKDKCGFCLKFGEGDPKKLLEIRQFSEYHFNRGLCEELDGD